MNLGEIEKKYKFWGELVIKEGKEGLNWKGNRNSGVRNLIKEKLRSEIEIEIRNKSNQDGSIWNFGSIQGGFRFNFNLIKMN